MSARHLVACLSLALGAATLAPACSTPTGTLCAAVCDCEHCNAFRSEDVCDALDTAEQVAKDYGCDAAFSDWVACATDRGECIERASQYTTNALGHCGDEQSSGYPCADDATCEQNVGAMFYCGAGGTCAVKTCATEDGYGGYCNDDLDCPPGEDRCASAVKALSDCEAKASGHGGVPLPSL